MKKSGREKVQRINCLSNDLDRVYHRAARRFRISDSVLCVLYMIYEKGDGCLLYDICNESGLSKQTINSAVRKLESEGVFRLEQEKGKTKAIRLTEKGKARIAQTAARLYEAECAVLNDWTEEEFATYLRLMQKYTDSLRVQIEKMEREAL